MGLTCSMTQCPRGQDSPLSYQGCKAAQATCQTTIPASWSVQCLLTRHTWDHSMRSSLQCQLRQQQLTPALMWQPVCSALKPSQQRLRAPRQDPSAPHPFCVITTHCSGQGCII